MKYIIRTMLTLILFLCMTVTAMANTFQLHTVPAEPKAGKSLTITISLDQTLEGSFRNLQGQLHYDDDFLTYCGYELGAEYAAYMAANIPEKGCFSFSNTDFSDAGFSQIPSGQLVAVTFEIQESKDDMETEFQLDVDVQDTKGKEDTLTSALTVHIREGKQQEPAVQSDVKTATTTTDTRTQQEKPLAQSNLTKNSNPVTFDRIFVFVTVAILAGGVILFKRKKANKE